MADSQTSSMRNFFENLNKKDEIELIHVNGKWKPTSGEPTSEDKNKYIRNGPRPKADAGESTVEQNAFIPSNGINSKNDSPEAKVPGRKQQGMRTTTKSQSRK